jgi:hypothetical protein
VTLLGVVGTVLLASLALVLLAVLTAIAVQDLHSGRHR